LFMKWCTLVSLVLLTLLLLIELLEFRVELLELLLIRVTYIFSVIRVFFLMDLFPPLIHVINVTTIQNEYAKERGTK
jgi:hypothetical protein